MITKTAMIGLAHFILQADPQTAQGVLDQLPPEDAQQVIQELEQKKIQLPRSFEDKLQSKSDGKKERVSAPSYETSSGL